MTILSYVYRKKKRQDCPFNTIKETLDYWSKTDNFPGKPDFVAFYPTKGGVKELKKSVKFIHVAFELLIGIWDTIKNSRNLRHKCLRYVLLIS